MINRLYFCKNEDCKHEFEISQNLHDPLLIVCPECEQEKLAQDITGAAQNFSIKQYNTVGSMMEKNRKDLGVYGSEEKDKQLQDEQNMYSKRKREVLAKHGIKPIEKTNSNIKIGDAPKEIKEKIKKGDKKAITDYIIKGKK
jgi:predicted nucleic acid-binding Zn ribbon protein